MPDRSWCRWHCTTSNAISSGIQAYQQISDDRRRVGMGSELAGAATRPACLLGFCTGSGARGYREMASFRSDVHISSDRPRP